MRFDINGTLLRHLGTGGGVASILRKTDHLVAKVDHFLEARTDIRRLFRAQEVARAILVRNDLQDLMKIRDVVAKQELRRLIRYGKQKDHTAHTVYLYLLGIWLFDHLESFRAAFAASVRSSSPEEVQRIFLFQWPYASLLHDIGYAFHELSEDTREDRGLIDSIYSSDWLLAQRPAAGAACQTALKKAHSAWLSSFEANMPTATKNLAPKTYRDVLRRLAYAPWTWDLEVDWKDRDVFDVLSSPVGSDNELRKYAYEVAGSGYGAGGGECVDHAVASGLLLFQYTSYWYWIMKWLKDNDGGAYDEARMGFPYDAGNVAGSIRSACRAAAYHNVQPRVAAAASIIPRLTLSAEPLMFLAIVCDELQIWDRFPAGDRDLSDYEKFARTSVESEDLVLTFEGTRARVRVEHADRDDTAKRIRDSLVARVPSYGDIVEIA
jgi:hypothetical protein